MKHTRRNFFASIIAAIAGPKLAVAAPIRRDFTGRTAEEWYELFDRADATRWAKPVFYCDNSLAFIASTGPHETWNRLPFRVKLAVNPRQAFMELDRIPRCQWPTL